MNPAKRSMLMAAPREVSLKVERLLTHASPPFMQDILLLYTTIAGRRRLPGREGQVRFSTEIVVCLELLAASRFQLFLASCHSPNAFLFKFRSSENYLRDPSRGDQLFRPEYET